MQQIYYLIRYGLAIVVWVADLISSLWTGATMCQLAGKEYYNHYGLLLYYIVEALWLSAVGLATPRGTPFQFVFGEKNAAAGCAIASAIVEDAK